MIPVCEDWASDVSLGRGRLCQARCLSLPFEGARDASAPSSGYATEYRRAKPCPSRDLSGVVGQSPCQETTRTPTSESKCRSRCSDLDKVGFERYTDCQRTVQLTCLNAGETERAQALRHAVRTLIKIQYCTVLFRGHHSSIVRCCVTNSAQCPDVEGRLNFLGSPGTYSDALHCPLSPLYRTL